MLPYNMLMKILFLDQPRDPEKVYLKEIMPNKIALNMRYIKDQSLKEYFRIILITFWHIIKKREYD